MRLRPEQLGPQLAKQLAPIYVVSGDEPLQHGEICDAIRAAARAAGHSTREIIEAAAQFDWYQLAAEASAMSLFAERKIIDLRLPGGKPGSEGSKALIAYCERPPEDTLLLLSLPRLDRAQMSSKWFQALERVGVCVQIWPLEPAQLPRWIDQRMRRVGLLPDTEAVQMLSERIEGNLLAAHQEIEKLLLLQGPGPINAEQLAAAVADSARYDVFELVDSALRGDAPRCLRILDGLRGEGVAAPIVLWALHRDIRQLCALSADIAKGMSPEQAFSRSGERMRDAHRRLLGQTLKRLRTATLLELLKHCQLADQAVKGAHKSDPWLLFETITTQLAGIPLGIVTAAAHPP